MLGHFQFGQGGVEGRTGSFRLNVVIQAVAAAPSREAIRFSSEPTRSASPKLPGDGA